MDDASMTDAEHRLVLAAAGGEVLDLAPDCKDAEIDEEVMRGWGSDHIIRAWVIRELLQGRHFPRLDPKGIRLRGAVFEERLDLDYLVCDRPLGLSFCSIRAGVTADSTRFLALSLNNNHIYAESKAGAVLNLYSAKVEGRLSLVGTALAGDCAPVLMAEGLAVGDSAFLTDLKAAGNGPKGTVRFVNAKIEGELNIDGAELSNDNGPAITADRLKVGGSAFMRRLNLNGSGDGGALRLPGASIGGQLSFKGAELTNSSGPAMTAFRMSVLSSVFMDDEFSAQGSGARGVVGLLGAKIGGKLSMEGAGLISADGPALDADGLDVDDDVDLTDATLFGRGDKGVARFRLAEIGGLFSLSRASLSSQNGPALMANGLSISSNARLDATYRGAVRSGKGVVQLRGANIGGRFILNERLVDDACRGQKWEVNDLTFSSYSTSGGEREEGTSSWFKFLRKGTVEYTPQLYQKSVAIARSAGHDSLVRKLLIRQRRDRMRRGGLSVPERAWEFVLYVLIGFGYQHWKTMAGLILLLAVAIALAFGHFGGELVYVADSATPGAPCGQIDALTYGIDLALPFMEMGSSGFCEPGLGSIGWPIRLGEPIVRFIAWGLTLLFVAGFTKVVRQV